MKILAVDTSCDETSAAVVENDAVLSNVISSQVDLHRKWGGVVPDIARRAHHERIEPAVSEALARAHTSLDKIDAFSATYGPGLAIALEVGLKHTQQLALNFRKPFIPVNHLEGHLLSAYAKNSWGKSAGTPSENALPLIGLLVSGGHTELILMKNFGDYIILGETLDDAAGEAFDKVATMLELGYPGGPIISELAKKGKRGTYQLPIPLAHTDDFNFSYSGLKTACLYRIKDITASFKHPTTKHWVSNFCADFVESVIQSLVLKLELAVSKYQVKGILLGGGVISNTALRSRIRAAMRKHDLPVFAPPPRLITDNAAMIGVAAYYMAKRQDPMIAASDKEISLIERDPIARIGEKPAWAT